MLNTAMNLNFAGAVLDIGVIDLNRAEAFYAILIGRGPDFRPQPDQREWHLHRDPEVAFRITIDPDSAGHGKLALGVADLAAERSRLLEHWADLPESRKKVGVITLLHLHDPDANSITLWQDLLGAKRA
ncbi:MAG: VOC family protein [Streptosporangiaceae bacterium]